LRHMVQDYQASLSSHHRIEPYRIETAVAFWLLTVRFHSGIRVKCNSPLISADSAEPSILTQAIKFRTPASSWTGFLAKSMTIKDIGSIPTTLQNLDRQLSPHHLSG